MNQKSFVIVAILAAAALSVIASPLAYAQMNERGDSGRSETETPVQPAQIKM